jgi:hypothetical protein
VRKARGQEGREEIMQILIFFLIGFQSPGKSRRDSKWHNTSTGLSGLTCPQSYAAPGGRRVVALVPEALCHSGFRTAGGVDDSTNKSLETEVRLFHNLLRLETVQVVEREAGLLYRLQQEIPKPFQTWGELPPSGQVEMPGLFLKCSATSLTLVGHSTFTDQCPWH